MFNHVTKIKNACVALVSALLCTGAVIFGCTVPVFANSIADDEPYDVMNYMECTLFPETTTFRKVVGDSADLIIPIYGTFAFNPTPVIHAYYSGVMTYNNALQNAFTVTASVTTATVSYNYFEPFVNGEGILAEGYATNYFRIYLDNYHPTNNPGSTLLLGYLHFTVGIPTSGTITYTVSPSTKSLTRYAANIRATAYEYGFVSATVDAIVTAMSVTDILDILDNIGINSGYLPAIFTNLQTNHQALYSLLQNVWNTDQAILSVNQDTYRTVLDIFSLLDNNYNTAESEVANIADDINTGLSNLSHDIAITAPSAVADISDNYIQQIDTTYNSSIFGFLSNNWIILMLCLVFSFAILSYMLYGGS